MGCTSKYWPYFRRYRWIHIGKWSLLAMYDLISRYIGVQMIPFDKRQHADLVFRLGSLVIGGFNPPEKILVRLDHHPNYWGKYKMFQTTNQYIICLLLLLFPHRTIICCEVHVSFAFHQLLLLDDGGNMKP